MTEHETAVAVVGGPSGLAMAAELVHHHVACVVVEPRAQVSWERPRATTTSARTMAPLSPDWSDRVIFATALTGRSITAFADCFGLTGAPGSLERGQQIPVSLTRPRRRPSVLAPALAPVSSRRE